MKNLVLEKSVILNAINQDLRFISISDIHDDGKEKRVKWYHKALEIVAERDPNYILIPGDTLESGCKNQQYINSFIKELGSVAPVVLSLGNHYLQIEDDEKRKEAYDWYRNLEKYQNVHPIDNALYETNDVRFVSFTSRYDTYRKAQIKEWNAMFLEDYRDMNISLDKTKYNVLLCHSPEIIARKEVREKEEDLKMYNLILSGHIHNGCTPAFVERLLDKVPATTGRGLLGPYFTLFPFHSRGVESLEKDSYLAINKGFRKFTIEHKLFDFIDGFYNGHMQEVTAVFPYSKEYVKKR